MSAPVQFSAQREDPRLEELLLDRLPGKDKAVLAITAAGCTLLQLATRTDLSRVVGADLSASQTTWARLKIAAARLLNRRDFCRATGISQIDPATREQLLARASQALLPEDRAFLKEHRAYFLAGAFDEGTFERLFAGWRAFVERFVAPREAIQAFFDGDPAGRDALLASPLWPVSFDLFFHQRLLLALFGPDAVQHAPPGSYPRYFQARFEWALAQPRARANPYLSHVLRGRYGALDQEDALPDFLLPQRYERLAQGVGKVACLTGTVAQVLLAQPGPYQMIQLSNILDWSSEEDGEAMAAPVLDNLAPGGVLLVRQLNNVRPLPRAWMTSLDFDPALERELAANDRSFFYSSIRLGRKA